MCYSVTLTNLFVKWEYLVRTSQYTVDSEMSYTYTDTFHPFFGEENTVKSSLHFCCFNCYPGLSITLHMGMLPQMEREMTYF